MLYAVADLFVEARQSDVFLTLLFLRYLRSKYQPFFSRALCTYPFSEKSFIMKGQRTIDCIEPVLLLFGTFVPKLVESS